MIGERPEPSDNHNYRHRSAWMDAKGRVNPLFFETHLDLSKLNIELDEQYEEQVAAKVGAVHDLFESMQELVPDRDPREGLRIRANPQELNKQLTTGELIVYLRKGDRDDLGVWVDYKLDDESEPPLAYELHIDQKQKVITREQFKTTLPDLTALAIPELLERVNEAVVKKMAFDERMQPNERGEAEVRKRIAEQLIVRMEGELESLENANPAFKERKIIELSTKGRKSRKTPISVLGSLLVIDRSRLINMKGDYFSYYLLSQSDVETVNLNPDKSDRTVVNHKYVVGSLSLMRPEPAADPVLSVVVRENQLTKNQVLAEFSAFLHECFPDTTIL